MAGLVSEPTNEVIQGTDGALPSLSKPEIEVTFATTRPSNGMPMDPDSGRANRIAAGIRKLRESGSTAGKVPPAPLQVEKAEPGRPPEKPTDPPKPAETKAPEPKSDEPAPDPVAETPAPEKTDPPAEPAKPPEEPKPDPVAQASLKADLDAAHAELALTRERLSRAGGVSEDDRRTYITKPLDWLRGQIAKVMGIKPEDSNTASELAYLQRELTYDAIGADTLPDERKQQRVTDRFDRSERLTELGRAASEAAEQAASNRTRLVGGVASVLGAEAVKSEFPDLAYAPDLFNGVPAAELVLDYWAYAVQTGRAKATGDDTKDVREALRLTNDLIKQRLGKLQRPQPQITAPAPATPAPTPPGAAPGTAAAPESPAPGKKPGSAPPKTLPPSSTAAPVARYASDPEKPKGPIVVDPHDRDARKNRILEIARRNRK